MDAAIGLTYMQQRYYDPGIGMFLSVDPVTAYSNPVGQFHRYRYANNNPYKFIDPDGRRGVIGCGGSLCDKYREISDQCARTCVQANGSSSTKTRESGRDGEEASPGAPTKRLNDWMRSSDPKDRVKAAKAAAIYFKINDRGFSYRYHDVETTASGNVGADGVVTLYPRAYSSWSWLGSTVGHEVEGHADAVDFSHRELWRSEQRAWSYSLENVFRFGNTPAEVEEIERAYDYYNSRDYED